MDDKLNLMLYLIIKLNWLVDAICIFYQREYLTPKTIRLASAVFMTFCVFNM